MVLWAYHLILEDIFGLKKHLFLSSKTHNPLGQVRSKIRRRGIFGFLPGIVRVTQLMNSENILFNNLDRTFQKQLCNIFPN